jgi:hypothetical protein
MTSFVALKADESITAHWGGTGATGTTDAPSGNGYTKIYSNQQASHAVIDPSALRAAKAC